MENALDRFKRRRRLISKLLKRRRDDLGSDQPVLFHLLASLLSVSLAQKGLLYIMLNFLDKTVEINRLSVLSVFVF